MMTLQTDEQLSFFKRYRNQFLQDIQPPRKLDPIMEAPIPKKRMIATPSSDAAPNKGTVCRIWETTGDCTNDCPNLAGHTKPTTAKELLLSKLLKATLQKSTNANEDVEIDIFTDNSAAKRASDTFLDESSTNLISQEEISEGKIPSTSPPTPKSPSTYQKKSADYISRQPITDLDDPDFNPVLLSLQEEVKKLKIQKAQDVFDHSNPIQNQVNLGILNILNDMQLVTKSNISNKESNQGFNSWPETSKQAYLRLWTSDPQKPATAVPESISKLLKHGNGAKIALQIKSSNSHLNWSVDAALCKHMKIGDIAMNSFVKTTGSQIKGISPFSCATDDNLEDHSKLSRLNMCHDTSQMMSDKDVDAMSYQKNFTPGNHMGLLNVLTNFEQQVLTWMTSISWVYKVVQNFNEKIRKMQHAISNCITSHGTDFCFSLLSIIHTRIAILIDNLLKDPTSVTVDSLSFTDVTSALEQHMFMNNFRSIALADPRRKPSEKTISETKSSYKSTKRTFDKPKEDDRNKRTRVANEHKEDITTSLKFRAISGVRSQLKEAGHELPSIHGKDICLKFHILGSCYASCERKDTHVRLSTEKINQTKKYLKKCDEQINRGSSGQ